MTRNRDEMELDLPFLVNGTLGDGARAEIEAWLADDALMMAERDALAAIRDGMQAEEIRSPGDFGLARLMRDVGREGHALAAPPAPSRTWMWQAAAAVAVAALLGQVLMTRNADTPAAAGAGYQLAGAEVAPGSLVVGFAAGATEEQIRALLLAQNLEIVAGPSALGLYRLEARGGNPMAATEALRAASDIVETVENAQD